MPQGSFAQTCQIPVLPALTHTATQTYIRKLVLLDTTAHPGAVCNDGSPAAYYFRQGVGSAVNRWVIYLDGAGDCETAAFCAARRAQDTRNGKLPTNTGSAGYRSLPSPHLTGGYGETGILSTSPTENPSFFDANSVEIKECSSDWFTGQKAATQAPFDPANMATWSFQGRVIVQAVIADLMANQQLNAAQEVLLTGDSSGGVGTTLTANDVIPLLPPTARTVIAPSAGYTIDTPAYDKRQPPPYLSKSVPTTDELATADRIALWNGHGDSVCDRQAITASDHANCYSTSFVLKGNYLPVPAFVAEAQQDTVQLQVNGVHAGQAGAAGSATNAYAVNFASQMRASFSTINPMNTVFVPDANIHEVITPSAEFVQPYVFPSLTSSAQSLLSAWYLNPCTAVKAVQTGG